MYVSKNLWQNYCALICFLVLPFFLSAQSLQINWGKRIKGKLGDKLNGIAFADTNAAFLVKSNYNLFGAPTTYIEKFVAPEYQRVNKQVLISPETHKTTKVDDKLYFKDLVMLGKDKVQLLASYSHVRNLNIAYARRLDDAGKPIGEIFELYSYKAKRKSKRGFFRFFTDPLHQQILVFAAEPLEDKKETFSLAVLNSYFELKWKNNFVLPYRNNDFIIKDIAIDTAGNAYMLAKIFNRKHKGVYANTPVNYYFQVYMFAKNMKNGFSTIPLKFSATQLISAELFSTTTGKVVFSGFYGQTDPKTIDGFYRFFIKSGKKVPYNIKFYPFENGFIKMLNTKEPVNFGEQGTPVLDLVNRIPLSDGQHLYIAEHKLISETCFTDFRSALTTCNYNFYFNELYVFKIDKNGEMLWKTSIAKRQLTQNDQGEFSSFAVGVNKKDEIFILYNDNRNNIDEISPNKVYYMSNPRKSVTVLVHIDANGKITKNALFKNKNRKTYFKPNFYKQVAPNKLLLYATRGKFYQFGLLKLK